MSTSRNPAHSGPGRAVTISTSIDRAVVHRRLPVPGYHPIDITERAGADPGTVTYRFTGRRAAGTIVIVARYGDDADLLPSRVVVYLGAGDPYTRERHRQDLPIVNGITLAGPFWLDPDEYLAQDRPRLHFRRATGEPAPRATEQYATAILTAILIVWRDRPQRPGELRALAVRSAAARLSALQPTIRTARQHLREAIDQVEDVEGAAAALAELAREHSRTGEQPTKGRSWFTAWSHAADHAPTNDDRGILDAGAFATWYTAGNGDDNLAGALAEYLTSPAAAWLPTTYSPR
jgi:hypothetical protein